MSYIEEIRALVGHRPLILVGALVVIVDGQNRVLMQHRTDDNNWDFPGGFMEMGETIEETAKREVFEETGLKVSELSLLDICSGKDYFFEYPNGDQVLAVGAVFFSRTFSGELKADGIEGSEVCFFPINQIPMAVLRSTRLVLEKIAPKIIGQ
ncbi:MAG TPA: NUDIX hydrolase [Longilinea sp.]|nr:NUDIX hydrolase [Longilinea sp.]